MHYTHPFNILTLKRDWIKSKNNWRRLYDWLNPIMWFSAIVFPDEKGYDINMYVYEYIKYIVFFP